MTDTLKNEVISKLRSQYLDLRAREADWSARYGRNHLAAIDLRNRMAEIRRNLMEELRRLAETYKSEVAIAQQRERSAAAELERAVARSQQTNQAQVTLRELESQAQSYRTLYDNFLQRYMEAIQQQSFPITEARVISAATRPLTRSHPQPLLVMLIAGFGGLALGIGAALFRDMMDQVFRTGEQAEATLRKTCIALVPRLGRQPRGRRITAPADNAAAGATVMSDVTIMRTVVDQPFSRFAELIPDDADGVSERLPLLNGAPVERVLQRFAELLERRPLVVEIPNRQQVEAGFGADVGRCSLLVDQSCGVDPPLLFIGHQAAHPIDVMRSRASFSVISRTPPSSS